MKKILFAALALLVFAAPARAQVGPDTRPVFSHYDLSSGALIYCVYDPAATTADNNRVQTVGSTTTVTGVGAGTPFTTLTQWAELYISTPIGNAVRTATARASSSSITVDTAIDISSGAAFTYRNLTCGSAATDGWIKASDFDKFRLSFIIEQINAASIDMRFECIDAAPAATPITVYPGADDTTGCGAGTVTGGFCNFTTTANLGLDVFANWDKCRMGMKINGDAGVQKITGVFAGKR